MMADIIHLKERSLEMLKKDLILRNPLRLVGEETGHVLEPGGFGALVARAGVGKTALLVQLALDSLLRGKNCLHICLDQPVKKVCLWYEEVFRHIAKQYKLTQTTELWEEILPHRFVMTFNVDAFSVPKLEERLNDLIEQAIFYPQIVLVDGLPFDEEVREVLSEFKLLARTHSMRVWFAVKSHRHQESPNDDIPFPLRPVEDLFDVILNLEPEGSIVKVKALKGIEKQDAGLILDPATLLIKDAA